MGTMVYSLVWVMQDLYHQPYFRVEGLGLRGFRALGCRVEGFGGGLGFRLEGC